MRQLARDSLRLDLLVIFLWVGLAFAANMLLDLPGTISTLGIVLVLAPPIWYLSYRRPKPWKKIGVGVAILGAMLGFVMEFMMEFAGGYHVVETYLPRVFGVVPLDSLSAHMVMTCLALVFYEHFIAAPNLNKRVSPRVKTVFWIAAIMSIVVVALYFIAPDALKWPYPYAIFGTAAVLPIAYATYRRPSIAIQWIKVIPFFFFTYLLFMIIAVRYSWWVYPPETSYLGWVSLFYNTAYPTMFPFEEMFFWMALYAPALVVYYKLFIERRA